MTLKSSAVIFQTLKPLQPHWPQQPLQPYWPQQPHFFKKLPDPDGLIINGIKMTNTKPFVLNGSSKTQNFTDIWYLFCQRLLRPVYVTFSETGWWNSNFQTSGIYRYLQAKSTLHISICQSQIIYISTLPWGTLYLLRLSGDQQTFYNDVYKFLFCLISTT